MLIMHNCKHNQLFNWAFWDQVFTGGGVNLTPLQISAPKGPIAAKFCMDVKTHVKSIIATTFFMAENSLFIMSQFSLMQLGMHNYQIFINLSNK